jgi:hypothetical protein|tara:strand:+ start:1834 stop:3645 length:1812 start_codon:yes stop_codon:yes gene_type:complete
MAQTRDIKYINREFGDFRSQLVEYAKNYFPDSYNDFSPTSPGMMFIEMASYVGDVLSFYQDTQLQETFLQYAKNPSNLYTLAYMMGYSPRVTSVATTELTVTQRVAAVGSNYTPNWDQALRVGENSTIAASIGTNPTFLLDDVVDFKFSSSYDPTEVTLHSLDGDNPAEYLLSKKVSATSGTIQTLSRTYNEAEKFATFNIEAADIIGILDITDSDGDVWTEVPFLGQDTVFEEVTNTAADSAEIRSNLRLKKVQKRFVTRFTSKGVLQVQFGSGVLGVDDDTFLPNPTNVPINNKKNTAMLDKSYDPSNFLFTRTYGLAPTNTTLTVRYLVGGGTAANVPANTITSIDAVTTTATDTTYESTITFNNEVPAEGGRDGDTAEEIRENSFRAFSEQKRAVTLQDYTVRALSLPPKFGSISKAFVTQDLATNANYSVLDKNPLALSLYVLANDYNTHLINASQGLKNNLKTYLSQYMLITDAIDIKDAFIVNIGVKFEIVTLPNYASRDVLLECNLALQDYFDIRKWSINQPINLSPVYTLLDRIKGVQTVKNISIVNKQGGKYSEYAYDVKGATKNNVVYPSYDPCIFEVKYPDGDIEGRVTTL